LASATVDHIFYSNGNDLLHLLKLHLEKHAVISNSGLNHEETEFLQDARCRRPCVQVGLSHLFLIYSFFSGTKTIKGQHCSIKTTTFYHAIQTTEPL